MSKGARLGMIVIGSAMVVVAVSLGIYFHNQGDAATEPTTEPAAVATVTTTEAKLGDISQIITAFGTVGAEPADVAVLSVPYECRVVKVRVTAGQPVDKGTTLVDIEPSPDAKQQYQEAKDVLNVAIKEMKQTQQRYDMKLATNSDLDSAQQAVDVAKLHVESFEQRGLGKEQQSAGAADAGLVSRIDVQAGQIVPAGGSLIETVSQDQIRARLGIEPSMAQQIHADQPVQLFAVNEPAANSINGKVHLVTQRVNPDTRLVDVFVKPDTQTKLLLEGFVRGEITVETKKALLVPRDAVLPDEIGNSMFTVKDGHAVEHHVKIGLQNDKEIEIDDSDVKEGDAVIIIGNYELEDGDPVQTGTP
jgi:membrane fusion protein, multidrug efflux system